jgi:hypothetical protein
MAREKKEENVTTPSKFVVMTNAIFPTSYECPSYRTVLLEGQDQWKNLQKNYTQRPIVKGSYSRASVQ